MSIERKVNKRWKVNIKIKKFGLRLMQLIRIESSDYIKRS